MMRYSVQLKDQIFIKGYRLFSFPKNKGKKLVKI